MKKITIGVTPNSYEYDVYVNGELEPFWVEADEAGCVSRLAIEIGEYDSRSGNLTIRAQVDSKLGEPVLEYVYGKVEIKKRPRVRWSLKENDFVAEEEDEAHTSAATSYIR